jgi:hypothetical protein
VFVDARLDPDGVFPSDDRDVIVAAISWIKSVL